MNCVETYWISWAVALQLEYREGDVEGVEPFCGRIRSPTDLATLHRPSNVLDHDVELEVYSMGDQPGSKERSRVRGGNSRL